MKRRIVEPPSRSKPGRPYRIETIGTTRQCRSVPSSPRLSTRDRRQPLARRRAPAHRTTRRRRRTYGHAYQHTAVVAFAERTRATLYRQRAEACVKASACQLDVLPWRDVKTVVALRVGASSKTPGGGRWPVATRFGSWTQVGLGVAGGCRSPEGRAEERQRDSADDDERGRVDPACFRASRDAADRTPVMPGPNQTARHARARWPPSAPCVPLGRTSRYDRARRSASRARSAMRPLRSLGFRAWPPRMARCARRTRRLRRPPCRLSTSPWHRLTRRSARRGWASPGRRRRRHRWWRPRPQARPSFRAAHGPRCRGRSLAPAPPRRS